MRITKIQIKDFRAFRGEYVIDLQDGHNLLVYGENGSGKSSLYQALNLFFASATPFTDHKNIFITTNDGFVKISLSDGSNPETLYEWSEIASPHTDPLIVETAKTKGFLDYKSLLATYFLQRPTNVVNVFDLFVNNLLAHLQNPITKTEIEKEWRSINALLRRRLYQSNRRWLERQLADFNAGMTVLLNGLSTKANQILSEFEQGVSIDLTPQVVTLATKPKRFEKDEILLMVNYYGQPIAGHHHFLNEARLSAIALSIYLSALLMNPPSQLRVSALDDVLIGLDMSNRLPLLSVLAKYFADWQIIITTYDKVWFEMVRLRVQNQNPRWTAVEFFCGKTSEGDVPIYEASKDYLSIAQRHLNINDLKAAAIYIRSAYEHVIKRFCDKHKLPVRYCDNPKDQKSEDFWQVVKAQKKKDGNSVLTTARVSDIELYRTSILNQLSHTAPVNLVRREVEGALKAVESLKNELQSINRADLQ